MPDRIAAIQKSTSNKCWRGYGENGTLLHNWGECKLVQPLWRTVWRFLKKLVIELPYDPAIPLLGIHTEEMVFYPLYILVSFVVDYLTRGEWIYFLAFDNFPLVCMSVFVQVLYCFDYCIFIV